MAMLGAFLRVIPKSRLLVAYVHHGPGELSAYRDEARQFVARFCHDEGVDFYSLNYQGEPLTGEADLREARRTLLADLRERSGFQWVVTAHHAQDVLETRLIRLIRGIGPEGLEAIQTKNGFWYRPFLRVLPSVLHEDLDVSGGGWIEDPSNQDSRYLRNWIRREWLPSLEAFRPGASRAMARSLESLALDRAQVELSGPYLRSDWMAHSPSQKLGVVARLLRGVGVVEFTRGQLEEVSKRLDKSQTEYTFAGAGCLWVVNAEQIALRPVHP